MILKLLLLSVLLFELNNAADDNASFNVEKILQSYRTANNSTRRSDDDWIALVQQFYDGALNVTKEFPSGSLYNAGDRSMTKLTDFLDNLLFLTTSNSTVLSSGGTNILRASSLLNQIGSSRGSPTVLLKEFEKALSDFVKALQHSVSYLKDIIGGLTVTVINGLIESLKKLYELLMIEFFKKRVNPTVLKGIVDGIAMSAIGLITNVANIISSVTKHLPRLPFPGFNDALTILSLIVTFLSNLVEVQFICTQVILTDKSKGTIKPATDSIIGILDKIRG